jgi:methionyl-tRNA formyltransferase
MTAGELHDLLAGEGAGLMRAALAELEAGRLVCVPQADAGVTYASKIDKQETRIDFRRSAEDVHNQIRGLSPQPGAWLQAQAFAAGERIRVLRSSLGRGSGEPGTVLTLMGGLSIACASGAVRILELQRPGKRAMPAEEFLRGFALNVGARL